MTDQAAAAEASAALVSATSVSVVDLADIWNLVFDGAYLHSSVTASKLSDLVFESPDFDPDCSFAAVTRTGECLGAVFSYAKRAMEEDGWWHTIVPGWIGAVFVTPRYQRQGLGRRLVVEAETAHQRRGRLLLFAGTGEGVEGIYPGIQDSWTPALQLFQSSGYVPVRRTCYVEADLVTFSPPARTATKTAELIADGLCIEELREALPTPAVPDRLIARFGDDSVGEVKGLFINGEGVCGFNGIDVREAWRNRGVGKALLTRVAEVCKAGGGSRMQLWTRPATANRFYGPMGFKTACSFDALAKQLPQDLTSEAWIARHRYV